MHAVFPGQAPTGLPARYDFRRTRDGGAAAMVERDERLSFEQRGPKGSAACNALRGDCPA